MVTPRIRRCPSCIFLIAFGLVVTLVLTDARLCPDNQTAELGEPGYIHCNLPEDFYEVYWYDDTSDSSHHVILYKLNEGVKSGPGFERGEYNVQQDGSLIITNVTASHERMYRVIAFMQSSLQPDRLSVSLRVTASPNHDSPNIGCQNCYDGYYHRLVEGETLSCSFGAARPPVQLEWFYQSGDGYDRVEMQLFNFTENRNGTYNSLAMLHALGDNSNLIHSVVCRATWPTADWRREKKVLVDISANKSFSNITPKTQYMEVNRYALIPCGGSSSVYIVWKRITSSGNPELVGFHSHIMTRTITSALDIEVSADGSLVLLSPRVHHEGMYACISGDWLNEEIQVTSVEILIPPSPPYIQITGCDDVSHRCFLNESTTKELVCAVYGVRPTATLEWIAEDANQISFTNLKVNVSREKDETSDTILSVEYKVSQDVLCGEEIFIQCNLHGPLSKIIKAESTAFILPASCKKIEPARSGLSTDGILLLVLFSIPIVIVVIGMLYEVSILLSSCKKIKEIADSGLTQCGIAVRIVSSLGVVSWMVVQVRMLWPIWKESDETAVKNVLVASLVSCAVVTLVLLVNLVLGCWAEFKRRKLRAKGNRWITVYRSDR